MHEMAIGARIVGVVLEELEQLTPPPRRLKRARVVAGALHQIVPEYLTQAYELLTRETPAEGSAMTLDILPVTGHCRSCGWSGTITPPFFLCGACGEPGVDMTGGRELYLDQLEVETA